MAEWSSGRVLGGKRSQQLKKALAQALPDWQVFVRRKDGRAEQFTFSHKRQVLLLAGAAGLALWAGIATTMLAQQPVHLAAKERQLDEMIAANQASQTRLSSAEKLVAEIAREVDSVHSNVVTLAESSGSLAQDPPGAKMARGGAKQRLMEAEGDAPETRGMNAQVRQLEDSLDRLRQAYTRAAQQTADAAANRISQAEQQVSKLGLEPARLVSPKRSPGQGGPFIPAPGAGDDHFAMGALIERMRQWDGMKAAMQRLPLALPIHGEYELNSGFGARVDPLNHRSAIHEGLDFGAPVGTPVYATGDGVVTFADEWDRYGNTVEIDHGNGVSTRYAHMSRIKVKEGQKVTRSTVVGLVGNTGRSTGSHLHYEVRINDTAKDPIKFISVGRDAPKTR